MAILPGPWGFFTSPYIVGLLVMAVLLHRIQNIVVPPARTISIALRLLLRLPSLFFLSKFLLLWSTVLTHPDWFPPQHDTPTLCWSTFCAVCGALIVDALTRGLGTNSNASPFNLFGYAFLLHIYSSPTTHTVKHQGLSSRPDNHVIFIIILPLLQLTIVHTLGIKQSWSNHRLIPSVFVSIIALCHFHWVLWFSDSTYPLLNYIPCLFESILLSVTFLAILLNAFTQFVAHGSLSRPLFGHRAALLPSLDEDFPTALLRIGTASLETSSVAGLGNEVAGIALTDTATVQLTRFSVSHHPKTPRTTMGFTHEIKNVKVVPNDRDLYLDLAWYREFVRFTIGIARFLKRLYVFLRTLLRRRRPSDAVDPPPEDLDHQDVYDRFIRGEQLSDDEHDEYEPSSVSSVSSISNDAEGSLYEAVDLYADLSSIVPTSNLLAHLGDPSPLTRRRFSELMSPQDTKDDWSDVIHARRPVVVSQPEDPTDQARRNCVVCTVEQRQIICWPCRCLALCDDCRANLASRASVSKHTCPCCRTSVEGYSKIYIP